MNRAVVRSTLLRILWHIVPLVAFIAVTIALRGTTIGVRTWLNPDEAELMAQARAAMISPLPFRTWASGTTGPFWVQFLALLGWIGLPLTLAFAHLLSAILVGLIAYFLFVLLRRNLGLRLGLAVTLLVWLPIALMYPVGGIGDFGALSTEYLPSVLILGAALIPLKSLQDKPWLFAVSGLLCGLAVGAKYQALPVAVALVVAQLIMLRVTPRRFVVLGLVFAGGAAVPFALVGVGLLLSPHTSWSLLQQNVAFLSSYSSGLSVGSRVINTAKLVFGQLPILVSVLAVIWLSANSTGRVFVARAVIVASGYLAVFAGGMGFGHYLILLLVALGLAMTLPVREDARLLPEWRWQSRSLAVISVVILALFTLGPAVENASLARPSSVAASLSGDYVLRDASLANACPAGTDALVWGWAPDLYVNYDWNSTIPYMNVLVITSAPENLDRAEKTVIDGVNNSDCIVDAVGVPFFHFSAAQSLATVYPSVGPVLDSDFEVANHLIDCEDCTVYVRK